MKTSKEILQKEFDEYWSKKSKGPWTILERMAANQAYIDAREDSESRIKELEYLSDSLHSKLMKAEIREFELEEEIKRLKNLFKPCWILASKGYHDTFAQLDYFLEENNIE